MERCVVKSAPGIEPNIPVPVSLADCYSAWQRARRGKKPSANQLAFEGRWLDRLQDLHTTLRAGSWQPARTVSFVVSHPKTREIHAPAFADRVVHHLLVERLERLYEPIFIHDSYANRAGKGSHDAVARLQTFMRQRENMPQQVSSPAVGAAISQAVLSQQALPQGAWFLQLDIHNFFNSIHRPTLYAMLVQRLALAHRRGQLPARHALALRSLCHKLLAKPAAEHVRSMPAALVVPTHKRLSNAAKGCGVPVGNLTSQFFANVYLNALDQFVKHTLKVRHYLRYVDDFVLLANTREELMAFKSKIEVFLQTTLHLKLKTAAVMQPCRYGADFLVYRVFAHHTWVRPRVVRHCHSKLVLWHQRHAKYAVASCVSAKQFAQLQAMVGSYWGHFSHANSYRLKQSLFLRHPWLAAYFELVPDGGLQVCMPARWLVRRRKALAQYGV